MTDPSSLKWTHRTQQGSERAENKDYFSIIDSDLGTWIFVIDVATSSNATTELAKRFCEHFHTYLQELFRSNDSIFSEKISHKKPQLDSYFDDEEKRKHIIQKAFNATKKELKIGVASFLSLYRCNRLNRVFGFCAGDCRLGLLKNKSIQWLSPVHTGANPLGNDFETSMKLIPERHILTKSLNLRRNFEPETFELVTSPNDIFVIATDGFWMELNEVEQQVFINKPDAGLGNKPFVDDTSVLLITWSEANIEETFRPDFESDLSPEFESSPNNLNKQNDNLLVINGRSSDFSGNENIAKMATKTENKNEY